MDIKEIKKLNEVRHTIENLLSDNVCDEIENLVKIEGYTKEDGEKVIDIPEHLMPETIDSNDTLFYARQLYYNPNYKVVGVRGTFDFSCPDEEDVDTHLSNIDLDGQIKLLDLLFKPY